MPPSPVAALAHEPHEVRELEPQRLVGRDLRAEDVAGARLPLAEVLRRLLGPLLVDRHLALELHVVEDDHLVAADDGQLPHLVRVEPREVEVGDLAAREAEEAEDDVLDAGVEERVAVRPDLGRLLVREVEDHRDVVDAERPERVLVLADRAEVLAVAVDAEDVAEVARVDELLELADAGVVEEQVAGHQHLAARLGEGDELLHLGGAHRRRLLDEDVLAGLERLLRERVVGRHGRREHDRLEVGVGEQLVVGARSRRAFGKRRAKVSRRSSEASQIQVSSPRTSRLRTRFWPQAPSPTCADADGVRAHSFQTFPSTSWPAGRVAEVDDDLRAADEVGVVDRRVGGDDRDAVVGLGLERRGGHPVELGDVRVVVGDLGPGRAQQLRRASPPGVSRTSPMSAL